LGFFRNRFYDLESGRWTQEDPIGFAGGFNLYAYVGNNPVSFVDPFGLDHCEEEHEPDDTGPCPLRPVVVEADAPDPWGRRGLFDDDLAGPSCGRALLSTGMSFAADALGINLVRGIRLLARANSIGGRASVYNARAGTHVQLNQTARAHMNMHYAARARARSAELSAGGYGTLAFSTAQVASDWTSNTPLVGDPGWYKVAKMVPVLGTGLNLGEAINSCRQAL
jgi:hypothetical protein